MAEISQESRTIVTMLQHRGQVAYLLRELARQFEARADLHDLSKFKLDEFSEFVDINRIAREHAFGSKEYNDSLSGNKAIALHFSRNRHHPEYHEGGVNQMNLVDFIEMVCDWIAASRTYGTTKWEDVITEQKRRFDLSNCQLATISLIVEFLEGK